MGSAHAALKIGVDAAHAGPASAYPSPDFTQPYADDSLRTVGDGDGDESSAAPLSASIQDENQRKNGVDHPGQADLRLAASLGAADFRHGSERL